MIKRFLFMIGTTFMCITNDNITEDEFVILRDKYVLERYLEISHSDRNDKYDYDKNVMTYEVDGYDEENPEYLRYIVYDENGEICFYGKVWKKYAENVVYENQYN